MKADKILSKQIFFEVLCGFIITVVLLVGGYAIIKNYQNNNVTSKDDLVIDYKKDKVPSNLYSMSDGAGLKTNPYLFTITNNGKKKVTYKIVLENNIEKADISKYLRISIDDVTIKNLIEFEQEKDKYVLVKKDLEKNYTANHSIKIWLNNESPSSLSGVNAAFKLSLESE